jgi:hypothetical protein
MVAFNIGRQNWKLSCSCCLGFASAKAWEREGRAKEKEQMGRSGNSWGGGGTAGEEEEQLARRRNSWGGVGPAMGEQEQLERCGNSYGGA